MSAMNTGPMTLSEKAWHEFRGRLWGFIALRVRQPEAVEDLLQEVFLSIHRKADSLKDPAALAGWVFQIARNAIIDHYRGAHRLETPIEAPMEAQLFDPAEGEKDQIECASCLLPMIHSLPEPYREALVLTELEGHSQTQAAALAGLSIPGMKSRVQRGRRQLRDLFLSCCHVELASNGAQVACAARESRGLRCEGCS